MLRTVSTRLAAMALGLMAAGPITGQAAKADAPNVAVDIAPVHSLVARVMEGVGTPDLILPPGASPHGYSMRPSEARALQRADLVIWVGEGLTPWLWGAVENLSGQAQVITLLDLDETGTLPWRDVEMLGQEDDDEGDHGGDHGDDHAEHGDHDDHAHEDEHEDEHKGQNGHTDDHAHDDDHDDHGADGDDDHHHHHGESDPHIWLDPQNASAWLPVIAGALAQADPENAALYQANATAAQAEIAALSEALTTTLAPAQGRGFVVFHDAYQYFETRFGLQAAGTINQGDAASSGAAHLTVLRDQVRAKGIACALSEPQFDASILTSVLGDDLRIGTLDPLGSALEPGPALYPQMLRDMARAIATCTSP